MPAKTIIKPQQSTQASLCEDHVCRLRENVETRDVSTCERILRAYTARLLENSVEVPLIGNIPNGTCWESKYDGPYGSGNTLTYHRLFQRASRSSISCLRLAISGSLHPSKPEK